MLIDLLDKKALEENNLDSLRFTIPSLARAGELDKLINILNGITILADKVRNYSLLIHDAKSKIKVKLSEQEFDLNALDSITASLKEQIKAFNKAISHGGETLDLTILVHSRTALQAELNTINKAIDKAIWSVELSDG